MNRRTGTAGVFSESVLECGRKIGAGDSSGVQCQSIHRAHAFCEWATRRRAGAFIDTDTTRYTTPRSWRDVHNCERGRSLSLGIYGPREEKGGMS